MQSKGEGSVWNKAAIAGGIIGMMVILSACTSSDGVKAPHKEPEKSIIAESLEEEGFVENVGWLTDSEILTVATKDETTRLSKYNIYTGSQKTIFETGSSYVTSSISPDKKSIYVQTSPGSYLATVTYIDPDGRSIFEQDIPSYDISFAWNEFSPGEMLLTSFAEDWSFEVSLVDINNKNVSTLDMDQPFVQWKSDDAVIFQDWPTEDIALNAPLMEESLLDGKRTMIAEKLIHFNQFSDSLMTIKGTDEKGIFEYRFLSPEGDEQSTFTQSLLSRYSDWLVPYYDMIEGKGRFLTFTANGKGAADTDTDGFSLKEWDIFSGKEKVLFTDLPLEPLTCAPKGNACLYGNQLEKVISLVNRNIIHLLSVKGVQL